MEKALESIPWVACQCSKCGSKLFEVQNDWVIIGSAFVTLSETLGQLRIDDIATVDIEGVDQDGAGELKGCRVRKISCMHCHRSLGLQCREGVGEIQPYSGGAILKTSRIRLSSPDSGTAVDFNVQRDKSSQFNRDQVPNMANTSFGSRKSMDSSRFLVRAPRIAESPARSESLPKSVPNGSDNNFATVNAKLNVITSQLTARDSRSEAHRVQIDELQTQIDALQRQNGQIVDLLENLTQGIADIRNDIQSLAQQRQIPVQIQGGSQVTIPTTNVSTSNSLKRGRGRPRTRCAVCRKEPLYNDTDCCEACYTTGRQIKHRKRMKYDVTERIEEEDDRSGSSTASMEDSIRDEVEYLGQRNGEEDSDLDILPRSVSRKSKPIIETTGAIKPTVETSTGQEQIEEAIVVSPFVKSLPGDPLQKPRPDLELRPKALSPTLSNAPFIEDSGPQASGYSDIQDPMPMSNATLVRNRSQSRDTSVAPSITLDDISTDEDTQMEPPQQSSLEDGEILSQEHKQKRRRKKEKLKKNSQDKGKQKVDLLKLDAGHALPAKPIGLSPQPRAPPAMMKPDSIGRFLAKEVLTKSRKPKPSSTPDGDDGHHKMMRRVIGPDWEKVQRRF